MNALPQPYPDRRAPRLNLSDNTPAVLRFEDGHRTQGQLEVISLTGGVLSLPKPVVRQSRVKLMFVTPTGPVLGTAEMLKPVSWSQQPFRFVGLEKDDQRRLQDSIQSSFGQVSKDQEWIDKYRAALDQQGARNGELFSTPPGGIYLGCDFAGKCDLPLQYLQHPAYSSALSAGASSLGHTSHQVR